MQDIIIQIYTLIKMPSEWGIFTQFQWVESHTGCNGNELADYLANVGRTYVFNHLSPDTQWKYITIKAIKTEINHYCYHIMDQKLKEYQQHTEYGKLYTQTRIYWSKRYKKELSLLSRHQLHDLLELRTGHDRLPWFQYHKLKQHKDGLCPHCHIKGDLNHFIYHCTQNQVQTYREKLHFEILYIYQQKCYEKYHQKYPKRFWNNNQWKTYWTRKKDQYLQTILNRTLFPEISIGVHYKQIIQSLLSFYYSLIKQFKM